MSFPFRVLWLYNAIASAGIAFWMFQEDRDFHETFLRVGWIVFAFGSLMCAFVAICPSRYLK